MMMLRQLQTVVDQANIKAVGGQTNMTLGLSTILPQKRAPISSPLLSSKFMLLLVSRISFWMSLT